MSKFTLINILWRDCHVRRGKEEVENDPQVYTTQKGKGEDIEEVKSNPQVYTTQEGKEEIEYNPQVYTTQEGIQEIEKNNPQVYNT